MKKSSAEETHGRQVEDVFKDGFENAEVTPPARLWENIDRVLENQELQHYKGQVFWYRSVAAACLILLLVGGAFWWKQDTGGLFSSDVESRLAQQKVLPNSAPVAAAPATSPAHAGSSENTPAENNSVLGTFSTNGAKNGSEKQQQLLGQQAAPAAENAPATAALTEPKTSGHLPLGRNSQKASTAPKATPSSGVLAQASFPQVERPVNTSGVEAQEKSAKPISSASTENAFPITERKGFSRGSLAFSGLPGTDSLDRPHAATTVIASEQKAEAQLAQNMSVAEKKEQTVPEKSTVKGWSLSVAYASQYSQAPIKLASNQQGVETMRTSMAQQRAYQAYQEAIDEYNNSYSPAYSYSAQVGASYRLNEHWQVESGLLYTQNRATTTHSYLINGGVGTSALVMSTAGKAEPILAAALASKATPVSNDVFTSFEAATASMAVMPSEKYKTLYKYQQVGLPIRVAYRHNFNKVYAFVAGGMNINLLLESSITPEINQVEAQRYRFNQEDSPFRNMQWAAVTSLGVGYEMNSRLTLSVAPELTYSFSSLVKEAQAQPDPYQLGLSLGGKWRLFK